MTALADLIVALRRAGVDADAVELADALWLAPRLTGPAGEQTATPTPERPAPPAEGTSTSYETSAAATVAPDRARIVPPTLARALSALRQTARTGAAEIDEDATAERLAMTGLLVPVLTATDERRFDLALILDRAATMAVWEDRLRAFVTAFEQLGVFRDVRVWWLDSDEADGARRLYGSAQGTVPHRPGELLDPTERRLTLLVSDCLGKGWWDGSMLASLRVLGRSTPLAVVQPLPWRMWERCGPATVQVRWRQSRRWAPNTHLSYQPYENTYRGPALTPPIPLIALEPRWLARWAQMVTGINPTMDGIAMFARHDAPTDQPLVAPEGLIRWFRSTASPTAQELAGCLAVAPLTLPLASLIRRAFVPDAGPGHFAELLLTGILQPQPGEIRYEFPPGVRDLLLDQVPIPRVELILHAVADFLSAAADPTVAAQRISAAGPRYTAFAARVLDSLGGRYADIAAELRPV